MKYIISDNAPKAVGPYTHAIESNDLVFCSGQIGIDPETNELTEGLENQTHQIMKNIEAVLASARLSLEQIVKTTIYLVDMESFAQVNELYGSYFPVHKPARSCVAVKSLPKNALIEIEVIASRN